MDDIVVTVVRYGDRKNLVLRYVDPVTGKHATKSAKTSDHSEACKAAGQWQDELRNGRYRKASRLTWEAFREKYEAEKLPTLAASTARQADSTFNHLERLINPKMLGTITAGVLSTFQTKLREEKARDATIAGYLRHLRAALSWAAKQELIAKVPAIAMPGRVKGVKKSMRGRPITGEEFDRMKAAAKKVREHDHARWERLLDGLWLSGLRLGEALALSWDDDTAVSVCLTGKHPKLRLLAEGHKANDDRLLPIVPEFGEFLLATAPADRVGLVFPMGDDRRQLSVKRASRTLSDIGEKAGVIVNRDAGGQRGKKQARDRAAAQADPAKAKPPEGPAVKYASAHDLRRAFATRWAARLMPAKLQLLMRHSSIETTLAYYVEQDADEVAAELWKDHDGQSNKSGNSATQAAPHPR